MTVSKYTSKARQSAKIPIESLVNLNAKLILLPVRSPQRTILITNVAEVYNVSVSTVRRGLVSLYPRKEHRSDQGLPRKMQKADMLSYCELVAAMKFCTTNKKGRHISTQRAIEILEGPGMNTPDGLIQVPVGVLRVSTLNHYLKLWGYDQATLKRESPAARYQAQYSNDLWHFDLSTSELKYLENPPEWVADGEKNPLLMIYSAADDRSGVCYQEYHCVYGEDTEAALRFLFNAMSSKESDYFTFSGIPKEIQVDNGPISKNRVFLRVMNCLGIRVITHLPRGADRNKTTARSKSKVERPFRTVKETHETLYHFNKPETEAEANRWLRNYLKTYNQKQHREDSCSRIESWLISQPPQGIREMCTWEQFTRFAREPEQKTVGIDARIGVDGVTYEVDPNLAGERVTLWWGMFDDDLFIEFNDEKYGPYQPIGYLSDLPRYRRFKKTRYEIRSDEVAELAKKLELPRSALEYSDLKLNIYAEGLRTDPIPFSNPNIFHEFAYPNVIAAKRAIADYIGQPIARLNSEQRAFIEELLSETLIKKQILERIDCYFQSLSLMNSLDLRTEEKENYVN